MSFDLKAWIDRHVIPLLAAEPKLALHACIVKQKDGKPPTEVCIWALAKPPEVWARACKQLLERPNFYFDYLRDAVVVGSSGPQGRSIIFGGDGTPFIGAKGMAIIRFFHPVPADDENKIPPIHLILEVGGPFDKALLAAGAVKEFVSLFDGISVMDLYAKYRPPFGT